MDVYLTQSSFTLRFVVASLVWILYLSSRATVSAQGGKISCSVQSVKLKENTFVICHFPENVQQTKRDFTVYYYTYKGRPDAVLDCWWLSGKVDCFVAPGFKFNKIISSELSLEIPAVSGSQIGMYACQLASYGPDSISNCDLKPLLEGKSACEVPSVQPYTDTSLSCFFPKDLNMSKLGFTVYHYPTRGDADAVLSCEWTGDHLNCAVRKLNFEHKVSDRLTVEIPRASQAQEGKYSCQTKGAELLPYNNCSFSLQRGTVTSCSVQSVTEGQPTELRCNFNVDVSVARQDFKVVRVGQEDVLTCAWPGGKLLCSTTPGYEFDNIVTNHLVVKVPRSSPAQTGKYACHLPGFDPSSFQSCDFVVTSTSDSVTSIDVSAVVGAVIAVLVVIAIIITVAIVVRKRRYFFWRQTPQKTVYKKEQVKLLSKKKDVTQIFVEVLKESSKKIYQNMETSFYFVPSLYINRNTYRTEEFAGEQVIITQPSNEDDMKDDKAMQEILQNLHQMAESEKEAMFVISQFNYNSYLTTLEDRYPGHRLPMPGKLRQQDENYGDFDLLIVHRQYGLLVVVVKTCGVGSADSKVEEDDRKLVDEVKKGVNQLLDAEDMLQHLLSDQPWKLPVHKTLMLPNVSEKVLRGELGKHSLEGLVDRDGKMNLTLPMFLRKKRNAFPTVSNQDTCLCAERLKSTSLKLWLKSCSSIINDEQYLSIISRFCGPASQFQLPVPIKTVTLPVTPEHSVCLTGKLFETTILHEGHLSVLKEAPPRVCLVGPPGTGKTKTLVLIGRQWMSEGHDVHVVSLWKTSLAASSMLCEILGRKTDNSHKEGSSHAPQGRVVRMAFDLKRDTAKDIVRAMIHSLPQKGELFVLCDEVDHEGNDTMFVKFCTQLLKKVPTLHLWFASCFIQNSPPSWQAKLFMEPTSCPLVILKDKQVSEADLCEIGNWLLDSNTRAPTEGPPVKYVYHGGDEHSEGDPQDCKACAEEVIRYLQPLFTGKAPLTSESALTTNSTNIRTGSPGSDLRLQDSDLMVLTECDVKENVMCFEMLRNLGFKIKFIKELQTDNVLKETSECVLIANGKYVHGIRRKVVVFLEGGLTKSKSKKPGKPVEYLNRVRCVTSCTSQLIWVRISEKQSL